MEDFPPYTTIRYYFHDKTISSKFDIKLYNSKTLAGTLILTKDLKIYFCECNSSSIKMNSSEKLGEVERLIPLNWVTFKQVKEYSKHPMISKSDFWIRLPGGLYSRDFLNKVLEDFIKMERDIKIEIIVENDKFEKIEWIGNQ